MDKIHGMKTHFCIALMAAMLAACAGGAPADPALQAAGSAAEALGGKQRIQSVKTLLLEGEGIAPNLGQNVKPDSELPVWKVTDFRRAIDVAIISVMLRSRRRFPITRRLTASSCPGA